LIMLAVLDRSRNGGDVLSCVEGSESGPSQQQYISPNRIFVSQSDHNCRHFPHQTSLTIIYSEQKVFGFQNGFCHTM
jgi:hypothetical protein